MLLAVTVLVTMLAALVVRMALHHERVWHMRRLLSTHGQRGAFYAAPFYRESPLRASSSPNLHEQGVTT